MLYQLSYEASLEAGQVQVHFHFHLYNAVKLFPNNVTKDQIFSNLL